jgi:hypothetical protein
LPSWKSPSSWHISLPSLTLSLPLIQRVLRQQHQYRYHQMMCYMQQDHLTQSTCGTNHALKHSRKGTRRCISVKACEGLGRCFVNNTRRWISVDLLHFVSPKNYFCCPSTGCGRVLMDEWRSALYQERRLRSIYCSCRHFYGNLSLRLGSMYSCG